MKIFLASDHQGYNLKAKIYKYLVNSGYEVENIGGDEYDPGDDFPIFAKSAITSMIGSKDKDPRAILICGSGQGMLMAANRFKGVRAGLGWSEGAAMSIRNDEDSNVLALPAQALKEEYQWAPIIDTWLNTKFAGATRFIRRINELDNI